jgi:tannase
VNETIPFCDPLDGKTDGVVSRTDLCKLKFNINSTIGLPYSCATSNTSSLMPGSIPVYTPAANGTVTPQAVAVAQTILNGLHTTRRKFAYFSYQPSVTFEDAKTTYNPVTNAYDLSISGLGGEFVTKFIQEVNLLNLPSLQNVTYDTLVEWMQAAWVKYEDTLQTTVPDLTPFHAHGGKVLTFHGEADNSIPAASSVHYYSSVKNTMYPDLSFNASIDAMGQWYRLLLIPGAAHCAPNSLQPNGPFPQTNLEVLIE